MWLKNLNVYRLPNWTLTAPELVPLLTPQAFQPCASNAVASSGWTAPVDGGDLVHVVAGQLLLNLTTESKLLPSAAVKVVLKARIKELEEQQGFTPGRRVIKELKERIHDELLPRALSTIRTTAVWIDTVNGWLVVDGSTSRADDVIKLLLKAIDRLPVESLRVQRSPIGAMTEWLHEDEAPFNFTVDQSATLRAAGEGRAQVKFTRQTLDPEDVRRHIAAGKQCIELALTWNSKVSFTLNGALQVKGVTPLDVLRENNVGAKDAAERFDSDLILMAGELNGLLQDLIAALGGFALSDNEDMFTPQEAENDALYEQARAIVLGHGRASVSLVQRHLSIGYNRAARLMDTLAMMKVVGPQRADGSREILETGKAA